MEKMPRQKQGTLLMLYRCCMRAPRKLEPGSATAMIMISMGICHQKDVELS